MTQPLTPIDDGGLDGRFYGVFGDGRFAVARWRLGAWEFSSGHLLGFVPTHYRKQEQA